METNRTIEQWRGCDPEAMAYHMSEAGTMYAFKDAKADILALHAENERLRAQAQHESDCAEAYKTEADRLRDENARLREDQDECDALRSKLTDILTRTANALKGEPGELQVHSWHDLPEWAQKLRKDMARWRDYAAMQKGE